MRIIDVHCYPNTREWIACQQPYVDALAAYWNRPWVPKQEEEVVQEFTAAGVFVRQSDIEATQGGAFGLATITIKGFPIIFNFAAVDDITNSVIVDSVPVP